MVVKERPILFSAPMVRAILEGRKTQTCRVISPQNCKFGSAPPLYWQHGDFSRAWKDGTGGLEYLHVPCHVDEEGQCERCDEWDWATTSHRLWPAWWPRDSYCGEDDEQPPHRLWVRETFMWADGADCREHFVGTSMEVSLRPPHKRWWYRATDEERGSGFKWRPSIFMPRQASRITLEITEVRVQRLQDISEEDAKAEGCEPWAFGPEQTMTSGERGASSPYRGGYACLWDDINGDRASWKSNPWVWAITFPKLEAAA